VLHADIERHALQTGEVFNGTAGSVIERRNAAGFRFYAHKFYDAAGKSRERYLAGPIGQRQADQVADTLRLRIAELKDLVPSLRLLGREGYNLVDGKTFATIAVLHNQGLFAAGAMLVGSHAYGIILNRLGIRAQPYATEDVDIARRQTLTFAQAPTVDFLAMLNQTGLDFVEVPSVDRKAPPTSFKTRGRSFHVDLLVPSRGETFTTVAIPELAAHAKGLPYLGYLLAESQPGVMLAREGCCAVRVPVPERFAVHKILVSRLRAGREAKSDKDVLQASVLAAALADTHPGALEGAVAALPPRARKHFRVGLAATRRHLADASPRAWDALNGV
jgi:hypothetical protein